MSNWPALIAAIVPLVIAVTGLIAVFRHSTGPKHQGKP